MRLAPLALLLLAAPAHSATPSFDCARASTPTEFAICDNDELARLDVALSEAYRTARDRPGVKDRQRAWIKDRNLCGANVACLDQRMRDRLAELTGVQSPPPSGAGGFPSPTPPGGGIAPPGNTPFPTPPGGGSGGGGGFPTPPVGSLRPAPGGPGLAIPGTGGATIAQAAQDRTGAYCPDPATGFGFAPSGDTATISYASFLANGHACGTGPLTAVREGEAFVNRDGGCTVTVTLSATGFRLTAAPQETCQALYCGARAVIADTEIPYTSRSPVVRDPTAWSFMEQGC